MTVDLGLIKRWVRRVVEFLPRHWLRLRRVKALRSALPPVTIQDLVADLRRLPIPSQRPVLVHSSLKALGFVEGGPAAVIAALEQVVVKEKGGTLMFPTYTISGTMLASLQQGIEFHVGSSRSTLGALPEAFRQWPGVIRSVHPTHSFAALGPDAGFLTASHLSCGSSFGAGSPMARLMERDGWLLGLGTNLGAVTFYHVLEDIEPDFPFPVYAPSGPYRAACVDREGRRHEVEVQAHDPAVSITRIDRPESGALRDFMAGRLEQRAGLSWHGVGHSRSWLVSAAQMYQEIRGLMHEGITIYSTPDQLQPSTPEKE